MQRFRVFWLASNEDLQFGEFLLHVLFHSLHEVLGVEEHTLLDVLESVDAPGQVFGQHAVVDGVHASGFEGIAEIEEILVSVELGPVSQTSGPGVDAGNGVGGGLLSFLMLTVVTGNGAVGSLRFNCLAVRADL